MTGPDNAPALVLNADFRPLSYFPLSLWCWQDAVKAVFLDDQMQPVNRGRTHPRVIQREHNFQVGKLYNVEDAKTALRDIFLLQLFDNVQVVPRPDERDQSKVQVDIMLRERPVKTAESELEWSIAPGEGGAP